MGEIRFVGTGETRGYPYLVCKKIHSLRFVDYLLVQANKPWYNYCMTDIHFFHRRNTRPDEEIPTTVQLEPILERTRTKLNPIYVSKNDYIDDDVQM